MQTWNVKSGYGTIVAVVVIMIDSKGLLTLENYDILQIVVILDTLHSYVPSKACIVTPYTL